MTIDDFLKIVQILFWITGGTIAVLTFLSAKKGLLNPINTEYHKIAFVKIKELSETLLSEFDSKSLNYWAKDDPLKKYLDEMHEIFEENKEQILKEKSVPARMLFPKSFERLTDIIREIKSEPFLPSEIRDIVLVHLESRTEKSFSIHVNELNKYFEELVNEKHNGNLKNNYSLVHSRINNRMYDNDCGIDQIEEQIHEIRLEIQKYFKKYDPIKNHPLHKVFN